MKNKFMIVLGTICTVFAVGIMGISAKEMIGQTKTSTNDIKQGEKVSNKDYTIDLEKEKATLTQDPLPIQVDEFYKKDDSKSYDYVYYGLYADFDTTKIKQLLNDFGFNYIFPCGGTILDKEYRYEYKVKVVLDRVGNKERIPCNEIYTEDQIEEGYFKGKTGICRLEESTNVYPYEEANKIYQEMFGEEMPKQNVDGTRISGMSYFFYEYNEERNAFVELKCNHCGGACSPAALSKSIKSVKETEDELKIDVYYYLDPHVDLSRQENGKVKFQTSKIMTEIEAKTLLEFEDIITKNYREKMDVYEIIFTKKDNNYIFKEFKRI